MIKDIAKDILALTFILTICNASAQRLNVQPLKVNMNEQAEIVITAENMTGFTAMQFNLSLPEGIVLNENAIKKGNTIASHRLTVCSLANGNHLFILYNVDFNTFKDGEFLRIPVTASRNAKNGEGQLSTIRYSTTEAISCEGANTKFNIVIDNVIKGDANGDGEVNVSDVVEIVNYIMGKPSNKFVEAAADLNDDGEVNVTDIVKVVSIIMSVNSNQALTRATASVSEMIDNDRLKLSANGDNSFSLSLNNEAQYVASQFEIKLCNGQTLEDVSLNSNRIDGHLITYAKTGENSYRVLAFSPDNRPFNGNSGELFTFKVSDNGSIEVRNILFVTSGEREKMFLSLYEEGTTGIDFVKASDVMDVYSIDGRMIKTQVSTKNGLKKGLYIINGKKVVIQ